MDLIYRYDPYAPIEQRDIPDATAAIRRLTDGNERFVELVTRMQARTLGIGAGEPIIVPVSPLSLGLPLYSGAIVAQAPFAAVVGCADARVPTEQVFDQAFNDLFVLRNAGNVLGSEGLGSLHYALSSFKDSLKAVVVLGHSKCGAVTAAVDAFRSPETYVDVAGTYALRSIIDQIQIPARAASRSLESHRSQANVPAATDERSLMVAITVYVNAAIASLELQREIRAFGAGNTPVVFGVYDFETLRVQSLPDSDLSDLRPAPESAEELRAYTEEVVAALLGMDDDSRNRNCQLTVQW